jgi:hypothetical protein
MCGCPDPTTPTTVVRDGPREWQASPSRSALHEGHVVAGLYEVPQARELAHVEHTRPTERLQDAHVPAMARHWTRHERVAGCQAERLVPRKHAIDTRFERKRIGKCWSENTQTKLDLTCLSREFRLHQTRIDHVSSAQATNDGQSESNSDQRRPDSCESGQPIAAIPGCRKDCSE